MGRIAGLCVVPSNICVDEDHPSTHGESTRVHLAACGAADTKNFAAQTKQPTPFLEFFSQDGGLKCDILPRQLQAFDCFGVGPTALTTVGCRASHTALSPIPSCAALLTKLQGELHSWSLARPAPQAPSSKAAVRPAACGRLFSIGVRGCLRCPRSRGLGVVVHAGRVARTGMPVPADRPPVEGERPTTTSHRGNAHRRCQSTSSG